MAGTQFGTFFELGGRGAMEALGNTGLDFVIIDTEHGCASVESVADYIVAAENCGIAPYVRIGATTRHVVLRMADIGARGLIIPNIRTIEQVQEVIDAAKFSPIGHRGFCPNRTSGWGSQDWAVNVNAYMAESNTRCKVLPQCETTEALEKIDEIAALDGVDGIFVGPFDLSVDMGIPLELDNPKLIDAIEHILDICKKHGKDAHIFANSIEDATKWAQRGFDYVTYALDAGILISAYQEALAQLRA